MKQYISIYDRVIPEQQLNECKQIVANEDSPHDAAPSSTRFLTDCYLRYVEPHELANGKTFEHNLGQFLSCPKCVTKVWKYFIKRFGAGE